MVSTSVAAKPEATGGRTSSSGPLLAHRLARRLVHRLSLLVLGGSRGSAAERGQHRRDVDERANRLAGVDQAARERGQSSAAARPPRSAGGGCCADGAASWPSNASNARPIGVSPAHQHQPARRRARRVAEHAGAGRAPAPARRGSWRSRAASAAALGTGTILRSTWMATTSSSASAKGSPPTRMPSRRARSRAGGTARCGERAIELGAHAHDRRAAIGVAQWSLPPRGAQLGAAERGQRVAVEAAAEQQQARGVLALQERQRQAQLAARDLALARAAREQAHVQARHRERGVEIDRHLVVVDGGGAIAAPLAAQRQQVVRAGVQLVEAQQLGAGALGVVEPPAVGQQRRAQQQRIGVGARSPAAARASRPSASAKRSCASDSITGARSGAVGVRRRAAAALGVRLDGRSAAGRGVGSSSPRSCSDASARMRSLARWMVSIQDHTPPSSRGSARRRRRPRAVAALVIEGAVGVPQVKVVRQPAQRLGVAQEQVAARAPARG